MEMCREGTRRRKVIALRRVLLAAATILAIVSGCPDGSLLELVGENGESDTNANLSALTVSQGELYPPFNPARTEYEVSLDSGISSIVVTGTAASTGATVSNNSGTSQSLQSGANPITITVTAGDGITTKAYVVTVNRGAVGALDSSFDPGDAASNMVFSLALQDDGKITVGGDFTQFDGSPRNHIARISADGSLDTAFDPDADGSVYAIAVQDDGKIVIGGAFNYVAGDFRQRYARLNVDGSLDTSPDPATGADNDVYAVALQSDGKILIGGVFSEIDSQAYNRIARLKANGDVDSDFDSDIGVNHGIEVISVQGDDRILIGGAFTAPEQRLSRLEANGFVDLGFGTGTGPSDEVFAIAVQDDGKIVVGGHFNNVDGYSRKGVARLNANGSVDTTFNPGDGASWAIYAIALQSDGKIIVGGNFTEFDGKPRNRIARLNADGSLDESFNPSVNELVYAIAVQTDGKILIAGGFTSVEGTARNRIARLK